MMTLPDQEAINAQLHTLAREAREAQPASREAPPPREAPAGAVAAPIYLGKPQDVVPHKYVLHYSEVTCLNCSAKHHESKFYALNHIRSRVTGQHVRHLVPVDRALFNLPVERVPLTASTIPFCAACNVDLSHLPPPPQAANVYDLEEPRLKGQKPKESKPKPPSTKATADDLA